MIKKSINYFIAFAISLFFVSSDSFAQLTQTEQEEINKQMDKYYRVLNTAKSNYVEEIKIDEIVTEAIKTSLKELDPHSIYMPPKKFKRENERFKGSFDGIGVQYSVIEDTINIVAPISGGPSEKLGIMSGDKIVMIEGESAIALEADSIQARLRGPKGTKVNVDIKRTGEPDLLPFDIIRDKIPIYSVDAAYVIDGTDIGYISINRFMQTTHREFLDSMKNLENQGMKKVIVDLRGNPGGYMNQAFLLADEFIKRGYKIVYTEGRKEEFNETYFSKPGGKYEDLPIIVLIDAGSASASEIFSGAIQDLDRGLVVGVTSYGKGLVQRQYNLPDGSGFRITIAKYFTPSGRCIQRPYKDEKKYRSMDGWLDLKEGKNINHSLDQLKAEELDSLPPIYRTIGGRSLLGGGGVTPDYVAKYDTITKMSRKIRSKNLFFVYARALIDENKNMFEDDYQGNFVKFLNDFEVNENMIDGLKEVTESKDIEWDDDMFEKDEKYLSTAIKQAVARSLWGPNEASQSYLPMNKHVNIAIDLFPEASEIAKLPTD